MAEKLNTALANQIADSLYDSFNGGALEIRTGAQPASADDAATGTLLLSITLPSPAFAAASGGAKAKTGTWSANAVGAGIAGWCRFRNAGDTLRLDGAITMGGGNGEVDLDNTNIALGQLVTIDTGSATQPLT